MGVRGLTLSTASCTLKFPLICEDRVLNVEIAPFLLCDVDCSAASTRLIL